MLSIELFYSDYLIPVILVYIFASVTIAKLGSARACGSIRPFFICLLLTPITGLVYVFSSAQKDTIQVVHYRCPGCGLEYTDKGKYCPSCRKDGKMRQLYRVTMRTY